MSFSIDNQDVKHTPHDVLGGVPYGGNISTALAQKTSSFPTERQHHDRPQRTSDTLQYEKRISISMHSLNYSCTDGALQLFTSSTFKFRRRHTPRSTRSNRRMKGVKTQYRLSICAKTPRQFRCSRPGSASFALDVLLRCQTHVACE